MDLPPPPVQRASALAAARTPFASLALLASGFALALCGLSWWLAGALMLLPVLGFGLGAGVSGHFLLRHWPAPRLGYANALTLGRLALAALMLLPLVQPALTEGASGWGFLCLALITLALDGVDGPLARRSGLAGPWGARFDMEVDSVFALLLAAVAWRSGAAGGWVLLLGGLRYLFVSASLLWPWLDAPLPQRFRRKLVCVVQIAVLAGLLAPVAIPPWSELAALLALALLAWSFALDVLWLARRR
ncbi:CDP-alcohol phosphatidyltransferase family protein [Alloyangia pacifica]|uniref:CDP-alcohol phosphatidyltransferase family protein n=1 Tax=Alloyangia pacifica TaxID=311180 RepID=UPI001CD1D52B|nr:CDP-alcohol phosphatidyltransferase family protein [Alloyangia pacifica]MCA0998011.1 CDP-alcohol phosphatidyltransferase family protein [Alloyangia pacifica]